mgnify:CR=1 FL=1
MFLRYQNNFLTSHRIILSDDINKYFCKPKNEKIQHVFIFHRIVFSFVHCFTLSTKIENYQTRTTQIKKIILITYKGNWYGEEITTQYKSNSTKYLRA